MNRFRKCSKISYALLSLLVIVLISFGISSRVFASGIDGDNTNLSQLKVTQKLKNGQIKDVKYTPAFSASVTEYHAVLDADCVSIIIDATTEADGAKVTYNWLNMDKGDNKSWVRVTAENGSTKDYYIYSNVPDSNEETTEEETDTTKNTAKKATKETKNDTDEKESVVPGSLDVTIEKKKYKVSEKIDESVAIPNGFNKESYDFEGNEVDAIKSADTKVIGLYLTSNSSQGAFYCYNSTTKSFSKMLTVRDGRKKYTFADYTDYSAIPKDYKEATLKVRKNNLKAWTMGNGSSYYLVYAVDNAGTMGLYSYNAQDKTFQLFNQIDYGASVNADNNNYEQLQSNYDNLKTKMNSTKSGFIKVIIIVGLVLLVLLFAMIHLILKIKEYNSIDDDDMYDINGDDHGYDQYNASNVEKKKVRKKEKKRKNKNQIENEPENKKEEKGEMEEKEENSFEQEKNNDEDLGRTSKFQPFSSEKKEKDVSKTNVDIADILAQANEVKADPPENPIKKPVVKTTIPREKKETSIKDIVEQNKEQYFDEATAVKDESKESVEDIFSDLNIDLTDSILAELAQTSAHIDEQSDEEDIELPEFDTQSLPDLGKFGIDFNKLKSDEQQSEDDFEFFDYDK